MESVVPPIEPPLVPSLVTVVPPLVPPSVPPIDYSAPFSGITVYGHANATDLDEVCSAFSAPYSALFSNGSAPFSATTVLWTCNCNRFRWDGSAPYSGTTVYGHTIERFDL